MLLYADAVGYSAVTAADELAAHLALFASFELFASTFGRHGGAVIYHPGDAVLAEFSTVAGAVMAAEEVQTALAASRASAAGSLEFRIGVNLGDTIFDHNNVYGDGVNIAERIQRLAEPGGVCISEAVYSTLGEPWQRRFAYLGEKNLKNMSRPVGVYRLKTTAQDAAPAESEAKRFLAVATFKMSMQAGSGGLDAEDTRRAAIAFDRVLRRSVAAKGGTIVGRAGDRYITAFGIEPTQESAILASVAAALDFSRAAGDPAEGLSPLVGWRVGIDCGLALVEGEPGSSEKGIYGPLVANSLWLAERSGDAGVYMTTDVFNAVAEWFDAIRIDAGPDGAVPIWQAIGECSRPGANRIGFVGRLVELLQLRSMLTAVLSAGRGCVVRIVGEAGIGKTRLAEELANGANWRPIRVEFDDFEARSASLSVAGSFVLELVRANGLKTARVEILVAELQRQGWLEKKNLAFFYDLLNASVPIQLMGQHSLLDEQARKLGKQAVALDLVAKLSRRAPLVIIVDNAEQADHLQMSFISDLGEIAATHPVAVLLTSRVASFPTEVDASGRSVPKGLVLPLGSLAYDECRQIAEQFPAVDGPMIDGCIQRSGGNPLFLVQLLQHHDTSTGRAIPATIMDAIDSRLASLPRRDNAALQALAVAGPRAAAETLAFLLGEPAYDPRSLVQGGLIRMVDDAWTFNHPLIREVAYASIMTSRRRDLHLRAAEWFSDKDALLEAEHLEKAGDERAGEAFYRAGDQHLDRLRHEEALALVERGLLWSRSGRLGGDLLVLKAQVLLATGLTASATSVASEAVAMLDGADDHKAVKARLVLAKCCLALDHYDDALAALERAEEMASRGDFAAELAQVHYLKGSVYFPQGRIEECYRRQRAAQEIARKANSVETEVLALSGLGDAEYARGRMRSAHELFRQCVEMSDARGWRRRAAENHHMVATAAHYFVRLAEALQEGHAALERAEEIAHHRARLCCHSFLSVILFDLDQLDQVRHHVEQAQGLARELNARRFEPLNLTYLAKAHRLSGEPVQARSVIASALAISEEVGTSYNGARVLGEAALNEPDTTRRKVILAKGEALLASGCIGSNHLWFYRDAIDACLNNDDTTEALRFAAALKRYTAHEPMVWTDTVVRRCEHLAAVRRGSGTTFDDMSDVLATFGYRSFATGIAALGSTPLTS
ncbi:tetratricopeptide repeat protein [Mesorhizobium sp. M0848]|uniref:tetratricopeptide repeat protein n=1 Tax=Mesorhizobium sp. M0848 TaxID=2957012 RepID=UPI00333E0492